MEKSRNGSCKGNPNKNYPFVTPVRGDNKRRILRPFLCKIINGFKALFRGGSPPPPPI
nr:hypothetical protein Iba_chr10bCG1840 [Ipomoea batatas]